MAKTCSVSGCTQPRSRFFMGEEIDAKQCAFHYADMFVDFENGHMITAQGNPTNTQGFKSCLFKALLWVLGMWGIIIVFTWLFQ